MSESFAMWLSFPVSALVAPIAILLGCYVLGIVLERAVGRLLPFLARRTRTRADDLLADALRGPLRVFAILAGMGFALLVLPLPDPWPSAARTGLVVLAFSLGVVVCARLVASTIATYGGRLHLAGGAPRAVRRLAIFAVYLVGGLVVLDNLGVSITPLLTTLGLAGLAVALAFQDTLSNFFAGLYVQADRPLDVGHYVRVEDVNVEGYVADVGWRTTKIRTLANNIVVIPNARVASSVVTDYDLPEPRMSLLVRIPVAHGSDPTLVETVVLAEATAAAEDIPGLLSDPAPFVRFIPGFTENGLEFTLIVQVKAFVDQYLTQHELRHRIARRFAQEGIVLLAPIRILHFGPSAGRETSEAARR